MHNNDSELIQRTLDGDQTAFTELVEKYQKGIHALAWRKIGDFHIAQEITQDAFLRAYERLRTLKDHNLFPGWIYVIASNLCTDWYRKKRLPIQSIETTDITEIDQVSHSQYMVEKRDIETTETLREVVQKLLQKLPESERTVMTLHYLGEMTCETISKMIGVSLNTVKSRLNRARNRLKKEEATIRENLSSFQLPTQLTENIMKEISRTNPVVPSGSKPLLPWVLSAASAILVLFLIGIGIQHLSLSFLPYDLDSESVLMVEIVETPTNIEQEIKPEQRNQLGNTDIPSNNQGIGEKTDTSQNVNLTNIFQTIETAEQLSTEWWTQFDSPESVKVPTLFATKSNDLYALTQIGLYRMTDENQKWDLINNSLPTSEDTTPMVEHNDTLYIVTDDEILASEDKGKTWTPLGTYPKGHAIGVVVKDNTADSIAIYLALLQGIFYSDDRCVSWSSLNKGLADRRIYTITSAEKVLFAGTDKGLFRINMKPYFEESPDKSGVWEQLPVAESQSIHAIAVVGHRIYIVAGRLRILSDISIMETLKTVLSGQPLWTVFRSIDKGYSWTDITPKNGFEKNQRSATLTIAAAGKTVLLIGQDTLRSTDEGNTWMPVDEAARLVHPSGQRVIAALNVKSPSGTANQDQSTSMNHQFYTGDSNGIRRSTDDGYTWNRFNSGLGGKIQNLIAFNNKIYAIANKKLVTSTNNGQSWQAIPVNSDDMTMTFYNKKVPLNKSRIQSIARIQQLVLADGNLYAKGLIALQPNFFRLDAQNDTLIPIQGVPTLGGTNLIATFMEAVQTSVENDGENTRNLQSKFFKMGANILGTFAISGNTLFVEHQRKLLILRHFSRENDEAGWHDPNIKDTRDLANLTSLNRFTLGVSGDTVYVGKPDGVLLCSVDRGRNWNTVLLPISVVSFKQIFITDEAVLIATDKGALHSNDGTEWNIITDLDGQQLIFDRFTTDNTTLYAVSSSKNTQGGVYRLTSADNTWERITPEIPDTATSVAVAGQTLYVGTENGGLQLIGLGDLSYKHLNKQ